jgi:hypothetical protein
MAESIFRQESLEHVSSPEQLYDYIKVSNPGIWIIILAIIVLMAAAGVWVVTGVIPTTVALTARAEGGGMYVSYLPPNAAQSIQPGMTALIGGAQGKILRVAGTPESRQEAARFLKSDYAAYIMRLSEWNIKIEFEAAGADDAAGSLLQASVITDSTRPLGFLVN